MFFYLQCNELKVWLIKRNCNPKVIRKKILKARAFSKDTSLDRVKKVKNNDRLVFTLTYILPLRTFRMSLMRRTFF